MRLITTVFSLVVVVAAGLSAANPPARRSPAPAAAVVRQRPDSTVENDIKARFQRSKIRVEGFTVRVQGGVAVIEGKTKVIQRKGTATRLAKLAGARAVDNRIQVDEAARERATANLEKGRRRAQVKRGEVRTEPVKR